MTYLWIVPLIITAAAIAWAVRETATLIRSRPLSMQALADARAAQLMAAQTAAIVSLIAWLAWALAA